MTREEELALIEEHLASRGAYQAAQGESSEQDPKDSFRRYKKKVKPIARTVTGKRRVRNAPVLASREKSIAAAGGLLSV